MKINHAFGLRENKPKQSQFQRGKMLLYLTIKRAVHDLLQSRQGFLSELDYIVHHCHRFIGESAYRSFR
jgi:hypothetical protein